MMLENGDGYEASFKRIVTDAISNAQQSLMTEMANSSACDASYDENGASSSSSPLTLTTPHNSLADDLNHENVTPSASAQQIDDATLIRKLSVHQTKSDDVNFHTNLPLNDNKSDENAEQVVDKTATESTLSDASIFSEVTRELSHNPKIDHQDNNNNIISDDNVDSQKEDDGNEFSGSRRKFEFVKVENVDAVTNAAIADNEVVVKEMSTPASASEDIIIQEEVTTGTNVFHDGNHMPHTKIFAKDLAQIIVSEPEDDVVNSQSHHKAEETKEDSPGNVIADEILVILDCATAAPAPASEDAAAYDEVDNISDKTLDVEEISSKLGAEENQDSHKQVEKTRHEHIKHIIDVEDNTYSFHAESETQLIDKTTNPVDTTELIYKLDEHGDEAQVQPIIYSHVDEEQAVRDSSPAEIIENYIEETHIDVDLTQEDKSLNARRLDIYGTALFAHCSLQHSDKIEEILTRIELEQQEQQQQADWKQHENQKQAICVTVEDSQYCRDQANILDMDEHKAVNVTPLSFNDFETKSMDLDDKTDEEIIPSLVDLTTSVIYNNQAQPPTTVEESTMQEDDSAVVKPFAQNTQTQKSPNTEIPADSLSSLQPPPNRNVVDVTNVKDLPETEKVVHIQQNETTEQQQEEKVAQSTSNKKRAKEVTTDFLRKRCIIL